MNLEKMDLAEKKALRDRLNAEIDAEEPWKPEVGDTYWVADPLCIDWHYVSKCNNDGIDALRLERGLVFRTQEEAVAKAKRMVEK